MSLPSGTAPKNTRLSSSPWLYGSAYTLFSPLKVYFWYEPRLRVIQTFNTVFAI